ncbi:hypothetical protein NM208_g4592 [Fusarium decemcellulare]|uniref:Uncharacterized protein n=1 Tax=Fusarium decemcellulare TaxID=57161 RepID=A0ACC1SK62_9HYPO|nr:hypothetical protein NM208_g4592 [Fusarium decemcellulare]
MKPVGGNWCWISASRPDLRYGMAHGWRLFVIFATILIYIYIWAYLRQHLGSEPAGAQQSPYNLSMDCNINSVFSNGSKRMGFRIMTDEEAELDGFNQARDNKTASSSVVFEGHQSPRSQEDRKHDTGNLRPKKAGESEASQSRTREGSIRHRPTASKSGSELVFLEVSNDGCVESSQTKRQSHTRSQSQINVLQTNASEFPIRPRAHDVETEIKRMMLLNGYPIMYVILWAPGLVNRLMEASGNPNSKTTIAALQASTQFVGLANALTYGFNHYLRDRLNDLYVRPMIVRIKKRFGSY